MKCVLIILAFGCCQVFAQNNAETHILNAAFEDVAPCPCDLTRASCDINCCCDGQCTDDEKKTFDYCIKYLPGGQDAETQQYKCASNHQQKDDLFPLVCVVFEYNAFLGYYYNWQFKLSNNSKTFLTRLDSVSYYWYREQELRVLSDPAVGGYSYGVGVKTKKEASTVKNTNERSGTLVIPQPVLSGQCLETVPVRYLTNLDHTCTYTVTPAMCTSSTVLSQLYYVQSSSVTGAGGTTYFSVSQADGVIAETNVVYKCVDSANSAYLQSYMKSTQTRSDVYDPTQISFPSVNTSCIGNCGQDLCEDLLATDPVVPATQLPDCASQEPSGPSIDGDICRNAVIDVVYTIRWAGNQIDRLDAVVIMADISMVASAGLSNVLSQKYSVTYLHNNTNVNDGATDNYYNLTDTPYVRSGKVGYDKGAALFSGSKVMNASATPEFQYVNTQPSRQIAVFDTGADSLCVNTGRRNIKFGEDISSGCKLQLHMDNFTDCVALRSYMIYYLKSMMPSDVLGRRGYNDPVNTGFWVPVLRDDLTDFCDDTSKFPLGLSPIDNRTGICFNITNGIHLDVFYGETGKTNGFGFYEVLGSKIRYSSSTWQVQCSGPAGDVCKGSATQDIYLTSSVRFTQIPPQIPEPVAKYYETPREEDTELCPGDRCWDNLFYPFTRRYMADSREYVFGMVSFSIIFFIGYGLITRPWW